MNEEDGVPSEFVRGQPCFEQGALLLVAWVSCVQEELKRRVPMATCLCQESSRE